MSDRKNSLGPAAVMVVGLAGIGMGVAYAIEQVAGSLGQVAGAVSAPGTPADRLAACLEDWTHELSTPWPHKLLPWRRWTPRAPRPGIR